MPLLADARRAGLTVVHLVSGPYAEKAPCPGDKELAGPNRSQSPALCAPTGCASAEECYGPASGASSADDRHLPAPHRDIGCVRPCPTRSWPPTGASSTVCSASEDLTLLYTGFLTNVCLTHSPRAMIDMINRGYRCVVLATAPPAASRRIPWMMLNYRAAIRYWYAGYSALSEEVGEGL